MCRDEGFEPALMVDQAKSTTPGCILLLLETSTGVLIDCWLRV